jgi:hypothetical protein
VKLLDLICLAAAAILLAIWMGGAGGVTAPPSGPRTVVILEATEGDRMDPAYAQLVKSPTLRAYLDEHGHDWELIDTDDRPAASRWVDDVEAIETPWLVIAAGERRLHAGPVPLPERAFVETLQAHGG